MSWLEDLYLTYESNKEHVGQMNKGDILFPIAHSSQNAQVEVVLDQKGNFRRAEKVEKADAPTMIPATEDSASRSGKKPPPHPLCDKLIYVAGDYSDFSDKENAGDFHESYMENLRAWHESKFSHPKIDAIYKYLQKGCLMQDLIQAEILQVGEDGLLTDSVKIQNISPMDFFVRFRVENSSDFLGTTPAATWMDTSLFDRFVEYYCNTQGNKGLCYITGSEINCSEKHPSKIRHSGDMAKLISANDTSGFTFRGNFSKSGQLVSVGYETSQKAHNALRWLLQRQGYKGVYSKKDNETEKREYKKSAIRSIIAWEVHDLQIPSPTDSSDEMTDEYDVFFSDDSGNEKFIPKTRIDYGRRIARAIEGYKKSCDSLYTSSGENAKVVVMAVDAATTGRLAVTYYQNLEAAVFLERMKAWYDSCFWEFTEKVNDKSETFVKSPPIKQIVERAFGTEQGNFVKIGNDSLLRSQMERLIPCVIDGKTVPRDIVRALADRASMPLAYEFFNWRDILATACALIQKDRDDRYGEKWGLELDRSCTNPHYLFGRLLAVADGAEFSTYNPGEKRDTNAKQLFFMFSQSPQRTWNVLAQKLQTYFSKMSPGFRWGFERWLGEISLKFTPHSFMKPAKLNDIYLLGFYHQKTAMRKKEETQVFDTTLSDEIVDDPNYPQKECELPFEKPSRDRSYLYGRLLAIADVIEERALGKGDTRETLAKRYFSQCLRCPASTWSYIIRQLQPYLSKMDVSNEQYHCFLLEQVYSLLTDMKDIQSDAPLGAMAVLGFYQQKAMLQVGRDPQYYKRKSWDVPLDEESADRDYLYGRLLATVDWLELLTFEEDERRDTNARRLFSVFFRNPYEKWLLLKQREEPYLRKLKHRRSAFEQQIQKIEGLFLPGDYERKKELGPVYLQGYFQQKMQLRKQYPKFTKKQNEKENEK